MDRYQTNAHTSLAGKVVEIVGNCDPSIETGTEPPHHGLMGLGAVAAKTDGNCVSGSGGLTTVAGFCDCSNNSTVQNVVDRGYKIIVINCWWTSGLSKSKFEEWTSQGVTFVLSGLSQHFEANDPDGLHSVPGVIHTGRTFANGDFWQYGSSPNMNLDVLAVTEGLYRLEPANSCGITGAGTSVGAPTIAGVVALMKSVNPCLSPGDIEEILVATSGPIPSNAPPGTTRGGIIDAYAAVQMAQNYQAPDVVFDVNETINNLHVSGNLIIEDGAIVQIQGNLSTGSESRIFIESESKLLVTGTIEMGQDARIIVRRGAEMTVDGGTITTHECAENWKRIYVEGNINEEQQLPGFVTNPNQNGVLYLKDALLENAEVFISMHPTYLGWPTYAEYYGGHVTAENTTFRNGKSVAGFMQYFRQDKSKFINCTIGDVRNGMTHWSNFGTTYEGNTFKNIESSAIYTYDAAIIVKNGNTFDNSNHNEFDQAGIHLFHTFPNINGSVIGTESTSPNTFLGGFNGIFSDAGAPLVNNIEVKNNLFIGGDQALTFQGASRHDVMKNDFNGAVWGVTVVGNGPYFNVLKDNQFSGNGVGIYAFYDNSRFSFISNCFDYTGRRDVRVYRGDIIEFLGDLNFGASNIFSESITARRILMTPSQSYEHHYFIEEGTPTQDRLVPVSNFSSNFNYPTNRFESEGTREGNCADIPGLPVNHYHCTLPTGKQALLAYIQDLEDDVEDLKALLGSVPDQSAQWIEIQVLIQNAKRCIQKAKHLLIYTFIDVPESELTQLIAYFDQDEFLYKTHIFGLLASRQNYQLAASYINSMQTSTQEETDFIFTQTLNLNRLENHEYVPDSIELIDLYQIGIKTDPLAGYARSLYQYFTDEKIDLGLEEDDDLSENRFIPEIMDEKQSIVKLYPNPFSDMVSIDYRFINDTGIEIFNTVGQLVWFADFSKGEGFENIDLSKMHPGIYYVLITDKKTETTLYVEKIIKH